MALTLAVHCVDRRMRILPTCFLGARWPVRSRQRQILDGLILLRRYPFGGLFCNGCRNLHQCVYIFRRQRAPPLAYIWAIWLQRNGAIFRNECVYAENFGVHAKEIERPVIKLA